MLSTLRQHWPEYLIEAAGLGIFMISAGFFATALEYPGSPAREAIADPFWRRALIGIAMGLTAIAIIYSPWGKRSGAHINPAVTLTFWRLRKLATWDALFYALAQFLGGLAGVLLIAAFLREPFRNPPVSHVVTVPGMAGWQVAFIAETILSFLLMSMVLFTSNTQNLSRYTGIFAGILVATFITFEAPLSGMSINPARSFASALPAQIWDTFWIYCTAPPLGMLLAAEIYLRFGKRRQQVLCCKLCPNSDTPCISPCCCCKGS